MEFKEYCREYLECSAILNYLKQQKPVDIRAMNKCIVYMDKLEQDMMEYILNKKQ